MSILAEALRPALVRGIFAATGPFAASSLSDIITAPTSAYSVTPDLTAKAFDLEFADYTVVTHAIAADCRRLSVSWLQSTIDAWQTEDEKSALPWSLVRHYYSAFYAAHVLARLFGRGCCWLEATHLNRVDRVAQALTGASLPFRPDPGPYLCVVDTSGRILRWTRVSAGGRGAHEALWSILDDCLRDLAAPILSGVLPTRDAQSVVSKLEEFRQLGVANGTSHWLSRTRNNVQYRLEHGVWHPSDHTRRARDQIRRIAASWRDDPMNIDLSAVRAQDVLVQFVAACAFLLSICRVVLLRIEQSSISKTSSFVRHGARAFANYAKVELM